MHTLNWFDEKNCVALKFLAFLYCVALCTIFLRNFLEICKHKATNYNVLRKLISQNIFLA